MKNSVGKPNFSLELFTLPFIVSREKEKKMQVFYFFLFPVVFAFFLCSLPSIDSATINWDVMEDMDNEDQRFWLLGFGRRSLFVQNISPNATMAEAGGFSFVLFQCDETFLFCFLRSVICITILTITV